MTDPNDEPKNQNVSAENNSNAVGGIYVRGNFTGNIRVGNGLTPEEASHLFEELLSRVERKEFDGTCPYKGLDVFEEEDAELFFGREKLVDDLVSRVKDLRMVFVTGPSGSGKSSLVRAGLIYALKQGVIKDSERWLYVTMKPGRDPIESLADAFSRLKSPELGNYFHQHVDQVKVLHECAESALTDNKNQRLVLFIDQFEEVFTQIGNEAERVTFLNLLTHAATVESGRVVILFSMRSDFVSNCATYPQLNALLNQQFVQIGAMQPEELVSAIAQPALRVGLRIDPDLIAQIINEMKGEPGALPLMQFALKDLFDSQQEKSGVIALTLNDYLQRGGIHKALERHADDSFSKLSKNEQELARSIFSGLVEIGHGTQDTRHTALFDELVPANTKATDVEAVVQKLADARLVTTDEQAGKDTVTISHEKLIDAWPWLKKLVDENRETIQIQNQIAEATREWEEHEHDASYLFSGARLTTARERIKDLALSRGTNTFLKASIMAEEDAHRRRERQRNWILTGLTAVAIVMAGLGFWGQNQARLANANAVVANQQAITAQAANTLAFGNAAIAQANEKQAQSRARVARAGEIAGWARSVAQPYSVDQPLLALSALQTLLPGDPVVPIVEETLREITEKDIMTITRLDKDGTPLGYKAAFRSDGKQLAIAYSDGTIDVWNISSPIELTDAFPIAEFRVQDTGFSNVFQQPNDPRNNIDIRGLAISNDGRWMAVSYVIDSVLVWDLQDSHKPPHVLNGKFIGGVSSFVFSPDGKWIVVSDNLMGRIFLFDLQKSEDTGKKIGETCSDLCSIGEAKLYFPDNSNKLLAKGDNGNIYQWDIQSSDLHPQAFLESQLADVCSSDKRCLNEFDSTKIIAESHEFVMQTLALDNETRWLVGRSNLLRNGLWDTENPGAEPIILPDISSASFSPDGHLLVMADNMGIVRAWIIDEGDLQKAACILAGRNFTLQEWSGYFGNEPYRANCSDYQSAPLQPTPTGFPPSP